jgi:hypothetical protein
MARAAAATSVPRNPAPTTTTRGPDRSAQGDRVIERARDVDSGQIAVAQAPGSHACGDDQSVEVDALAVV